MQIHITEKRMVLLLAKKPSEALEVVAAASGVGMPEKQFQKYRRAVLKRGFVYPATALLFSRHQQWLELSDLKLFPGKWFLFPDILKRFSLKDINKTLLADCEYWSDKRFVVRSISPEQFLEVSELHELLNSVPDQVTSVARVYQGTERYWEYPEEHLKEQYTGLDTEGETLCQVIKSVDTVANDLEKLKEDTHLYLSNYLKATHTWPSMAETVRDEKCMTGADLIQYARTKLEISIGSTIWERFPMVTEHIVALVWEDAWRHLLASMDGMKNRLSGVNLVELLKEEYKNPPSMETLMCCKLHYSSTEVSIPTVILEALNLFEAQGIALPVEKSNFYTLGDEAPWSEYLDLVDQIFNKLPNDYINNFFGGNNGE